MTKSLKQDIKSYYTHKTLRPEKMNLLLQQIELANASQSKEQNHKKLSIYSNWASSRIHLLAYGLTFTILVSISFLLTIWYPFDQQTFEQRVVEEIVMNHEKQLQPDFTTRSLDILANQMHKLDFKPQQLPNNMMLQNTLLGGRYCSIQGNIALQLKLRSPEGKLLTLYQTRLTPNLKLLAKGQNIIGDVKVTYGNSNNIFWGLAESF